MALLAVLITLVIYGFIFWVLWWALKTVALPEPFNKGAVLVLVLASVVVVIGVLTASIPPFPFTTNLGVR